MYDQTPAPLPESDTSSSFFEIWIAALTKPDEATYRQFANSPRASTGTAYLWMAISGAISFFFYFLVTSFIGTSPYYGSGELISTLTCFFPITLVATLIGFTISAGYAYLMGRALGGNATFDQLAYTLAAYMAPLGLVSSIISVIPVVRCLGIVIAIYGIVLSVTAIKAAQGLDWGKAFLASPAALALVLFLLAACVIIIMLITGPTIGNVFSDIYPELNMP